MAAPPRVRVIVLTHAGAALLPRSLPPLLATDWPADRFDVVVVDNASTDGSGQVARDLGARVRHSEANLGFPANNLELIPTEADVFVLLNDDVVVRPGWLAPLVKALDAGGDGGRRIGAAQPTMVFDRRYALCALPATAVGDRLVRVVVDGCDVTDLVQPVSGLGDRSGGNGRLVAAGARMWVPLDVATTVELELARAGPVTVESGDPAELVQNAGIEVTDDHRGRDRLAWTPVGDLSNDPVGIEGWCGGAVALSAAYVADVGVFEPSLFLYYEDLDLSWRGARRGWTYLHVPAAQVVHPQGATVGTASGLHRHWTTRNRLVVLTRAGAPGAARRAWIDELRGLVWHLRDARRRHKWGEVAWRGRALASAAVATPRAMRARRRLSHSAQQAARAKLLEPPP